MSFVEPEKMATESTPLIQIVRVATPRHRYTHSTTRRFCTIASLGLLVVGFAFFTIDALFVWPEHYHYGNRSRYSESFRNGKTSLSHHDLEAILLDTPSSEHAEEWLRYYTAGPHLAGKNLSQAEWTRDKWEEWGIKSEIVPYDVYINYPKDHSLSLLKQSKKSDSWKVIFKASLEEDVLNEDPTTGLNDRVPTFHGYSASGNVTGSFVYVNYGSYWDYQDLVDAGIDLKGKIVIAKYGGVFRGLKVKRAQELGAIGALIYCDPGDDGKFTEENGYKNYPEGPARHPSSVQRGSVQFISTRPGDPTTPGYPSKPGVPRAPADDTTPSIPSIPISYTDALPILRALNGHGPKSTDFNKYWNRNKGLKYKGVDYNIGPSPDDLVVNLYNEQEYVTTPLWDVIGIVNGTSVNEVVIIGNHRDAWIAGGAGDPNSGSAALNEVIRSVGKALEGGWTPLRTIVFASWDGEEYGLIGSTEWVEEYLPWLQDANVAYVNLDIAVSGPEFEGGATPTLSEALRDATKKILSPNQTVEGQTIWDLWSRQISPLGSGSDFTAFQDYAGVPCLSFGFTAGKDSPVYHDHSNYDSFYWMEKYGDPGFKYHKSMAQLFGILIANLVDSIVIPFSATEYADDLNLYLDSVESKLKSEAEPTSDAEIFDFRARTSFKEVVGSVDELKKSLLGVREAIERLKIRAKDIDDEAAWANCQLEEGIPWWNIIAKAKLAKAITKVNNAYKHFEQQFLFKDGLDGRNWFKHVVYAPGLWTGYSGGKFFFAKLIRVEADIL